MERAWSHVNPIIPRSWEKNLNLGWVILGFTMVYLIVWHNFLHQDEIVAVDDLVWICIGISSGKLPVDSIDIKSNLLSPQVYSKGHHHNNPSSIIHHPSSIILIVIIRIIIRIIIIFPQGLAYLWVLHQRLEFPHSFWEGIQRPPKWLWVSTCWVI